MKFKEVPQIPIPRRRELIDSANEARKLQNRAARGASYGAAVLTLNDNIFSAGSFFSSTHSLSLHAEHAALVHCALHGEPLIKAIAIASDDPETLATPCGLCRQLIFENARQSGLNVVVLTLREREVSVESTIVELYPLPWPDRKPRNI
ncbi:cytidine deaminase family protein [Persicimonas caeni]|nr:hypothetical protein [Persicimonas caeni]